MIQKVTVQTSEKIEVINVTDTATALLNNVQSGIALFSVPHTTAALIICEDEDDLRGDIARAVENWLAPARPFKHIQHNNPNAEAHILGATLGASVTLAIENGRLNLGTYQSVLLVELDGPRAREIHAVVITS
jgi:secondary thiamine-phosphate synthase enzyme